MEVVSCLSSCLMDKWICFFAFISLVISARLVPPSCQTQILEFLTFIWAAVQRVLMMIFRLFNYLCNCTLAVWGKRRAWQMMVWKMVTANGVRIPTWLWLLDLPSFVQKTLSQFWLLLNCLKKISHQYHRIHWHYPLQSGNIPYHKKVRSRLWH